MILKLLKDRITNFWILLLNYSWYVNRNALNSNCPLFENGNKAPLMITNIKTFVINFALLNFVWHSKNTQRYISRNWKKVAFSVAFPVYWIIKIPLNGYSLEMLPPWRFSWNVFLLSIIGPNTSSKSWEYSGDISKYHISKTYMVVNRKWFSKAGKLHCFQFLNNCWIIQI